MATNIHDAGSPAIQAGGIPRAVKGLSLVSLFNDFASEMVYPLLPAFVTRTLGGGALLLGLLDGASELTSSLLKWASGRLADNPRWRKPLILSGYAVAVLVRPLIAVSSAAWQVVGFRVIDRVGKGIRTPPRDAMISDVTPAELQGRAFGFHRGADHLGAVVGSLAAWVLLQRGAEVRSVIGWSAVPGAVAVVVLAAVLTRVTARRSPVAGSKRSQPDDRRLATGDSFWPSILALTALTFFRLPETLLILRIQDRGVAVAAVPLVWAGLHVVRSASSYPGGWLSDRAGPRRAVAAGGVLFATIVFLLGRPVSAYAAMGLFLALGLVAGLTESGERALVARLVPKRIGRSFGVYHALTGGVALPAGLVFGALYQASGGPVALQVAAVGMALAVMGWLMVSRVKS